MDTAKPIEDSLYTMVEKAAFRNDCRNYSYLIILEKY